MEKSSFFNSVAGDRKYDADDFASYFNSLVTNGVFPSLLQVISNSNMTITIKSGKAWINGKVYINTEDLILPITVADGLLNRIDRVVIQLNTTNRNIIAAIKQGTSASTPIAPILTRDADIYELGIADILINKGVATITQSNITDLRQNTAYCGWVNSLIQVDGAELFAQYQDSFNTWFADVQNALGADVAGNLLNKININTDDISGLEIIVSEHNADNSKHLTTMTTQGDMVYRGATTPVRLAKGTDGQTLSLVNGLPSWVNKLTMGTIEYSPGTNILYTSVGANGTTSSTYVVGFSITMNISGKVRFSFEHKIANSSDYSYYSLTVAGVEKGTSITSSTTYVLESLDVDVKAGDIVQLLHRSAFGTFSATVQNFKIGVAMGAI